MKKKLLIFVPSMLVLFSAAATPLNPEEALARMKGETMKSAPMAQQTLELAYTQASEQGVPAAYVFVPKSGKGYTILSADDRAVPVIGYSNTGCFDKDNMPEALKWWLQECGKRASESTGNSARMYVSKSLEGLPAISPLMTTTWNQDAPFNNNCPTVGGATAPTGCVATSFAQVMNYHKYPEKGKGSISYSSGGVQRSMNFSRVTFKWDEMIDSYSGSYTEEQAAAVAELMKACGYSVKMGYGQYMSGAVSYRLQEAAVTYFSYDSNISYLERKWFSTDEWSKRIYDNIKNFGPVICDGRSRDGGHSFVCDGYDGKGYFHFNWGWGGMSDGYFVLDVLAPESQGIGGAEGGFNYSQSALFGMCKPGENTQVNYDKMAIYGSVSATMSGNNLVFTTKSDGGSEGWGNGSFRKIQVNPGVIITDAQNNVVYEGAGTIKFSNGSEVDVLSLEAGSYYSPTMVNPVMPMPESLADGTYKVTLAARQYDTDGAPWTPMYVDYGKANYCYLVVKDGVKSVQNASVCELKFNDVVFGSPLYTGRNSKLVSTVENDSDLQLTLCYMPELWRDGRVQYQGDVMLITVDPNTTLEKSTLVAFQAVSDATATGSGTYTLKIVNPANGAILGTFGDYEMSYINGGTKVQLTELEIENAEQADITLGSRDFKNVYMLDSPEFDINFGYQVKTGYFDTSVRLIVSQYNPSANSFIADQENLYYDQPFAGQGEERHMIVPVDFRGRDLSTLYRITATCLISGQNTTLGRIDVAFNNSGVEEFEADGSVSDVEYYNLQGVRIYAPVKGQLLIRKAGSKIQKVIY